MTNQRIRFTQIDETNRGDHTHFRDGDQWAFLFEKTSGRDYNFSETNSLISNLKKPVTATQAQLNYKTGAIRTCAASLRQAINEEWLDSGTFVPIPPSKAISDPLYDNRMERVCKLIRPGNVDVRSLVVQNQSMMASHERPPGTRIAIDELVASYSIDESLADPHPHAIAVVDDMLTAGAHYRAMHNVLSGRFPQAFIFGMFIARRVFPDESDF